MSLVSVRRKRTIATAILFAALACSAPLRAQETSAPTPNRVIYPGDIINEDMLADIAVDRGPPTTDTAIYDRAELIGKVAKRTLLPGQRIFPTFIANPRAIANGAQVTLVYREGGLTIVTTAQALEPGGVGDTIRVRNADSGVTISGRIMPDGTVSVGNS